MSKRKANREKWYALIKEYESGDQHQTDFCRDHQINKHTFAYWLNQYHQSQASPVIKGFVSLQGISKSESISIRYRSGVELELPGGFPLEGLIKLVQLG